MMNSVLAISEHGARSSVCDEAKAIVRKHKATPKEVDMQITQYRKDGLPADKRFNGRKGFNDYGEFIAATVDLNKLEREEHLVAAFRYFDKDGSGYITVDELQQACAEHNMTDVLLEDIIREVDQDNDGRINYGEFVAMVLIFSLLADCTADPEYDDS
ncbi:hypothetical protein Gotur_008578 [Gossypium turneri]